MAVGFVNAYVRSVIIKLKKGSVMELYIQISFWLGIAGISINMIGLLMSEFPQTKEKTIGEVLFQIILGIGFAVWAGSLIY